MRIWLINPYGPLPTEGWREYYFTTLGKTLAAAGHRTTWWTSNFSHHFAAHRSPGWATIPVTESFEIRLIPTIGYKSHIGVSRVASEAVLALNLFRLAGAEPPPDLIVAGDSPLPPSIVSAILARRFQVPFVLAAMDQWPELFELALPKRIRRWAPSIFAPLYWTRRYVRRHSDAVISLCDGYLRAVLRDHAVRNGIATATIFNGIDVDTFRQAAAEAHTAPIPDLPPKQADEIWAVFAGTFGNNYDIPTIAEAARLLQTSCPRIKLILGGGGPLVGLIHSAIAENGLSNIVYCGSLPAPKLAVLYSSCDIALCAYSPESNVGMPDKVYDYMAAGLPIVNSLRGELAERIETLDMGQAYQPGDAVSLASAIRRLADDEQLRARQAQNAYNAAKRFDRAVQFRQIVDIVNRLAAPTPPRALANVH